MHQVVGHTLLYSHTCANPMTPNSNLSCTPNCRITCMCAVPHTSNSHITDACVQLLTCDQQLVVEPTSSCSRAVWVQKVATQRVARPRLKNLVWQCNTRHAQPYKVLLGVTGHLFGIPGGDVSSNGLPVAAMCLEASQEGRLFRLTPGLKGSKHIITAGREVLEQHPFHQRLSLSHMGCMGTANSTACDDMMSVGCIRCQGVQHSCHLQQKQHCMVCC